MLNQLVKKIQRKIYLREYSDKLKPISKSEEQLIENLKENFKKIPVIDTTNLSGSALVWSANMNRLRELVLHDDPRKFLQWDVIRKTMFVGKAPFIVTELESLKRSAIFNQYWKQGIIESEIGLPSKAKNYMHSSGNLIHHAYHVQQFEEKTKVKVKHIDFVLEFGGGYGSMCRLFRNLDFNNRYVIFDLPSFSLLQKYYLKSLGYSILTTDEFCSGQTGILCISTMEELKLVLKTIDPQHKNLFLATWSISESPINIRNSIVELLENFNLFLIAYQNEFGEVDNKTYFDKLKKQFPKIHWDTWMIEHLPKNYYLIGNGVSV